MRSKKSATPFIAVLLAFMLPLVGCQRLSQQTGKEVDPDPKSQNQGKPTPTPTANTGKGEVGNLVPFSYNEGFSPLYGYRDMEGRTVIEPKFKYAFPFYECGLAVVYAGHERYGLIDKSGNYVLEPEYDYITYSEGVIIGTNYEKNGSEVFDLKGQKLFEADDYFSYFNEGLTGLYKKGYMDKGGQLVISLPGYESLGPFMNGIARVNEDYLGAPYYIDKKGKDVTDTVSSGLRMFKDETTQSFGFMNAQGEVVIEPQFIEAEPFLDGYAIVMPDVDQENNDYGVIDTQGQFILEPVYCGIQRLSNGLVAVGEEVNPEDYVPSSYFYYANKALFTPDFSLQTDWIYPLTEDFDQKYICVNDKDSVFFMDADFNRVADMPDLKGYGSFTGDGNLLRGEYNGYLSVVDRNGNLLTNGDEWIDLGEGLKARRMVKSLDRIATLEYPILSGLDDESIENRLNQLILEEMVIPYEGEFTDGEDSTELNNGADISTFTSFFIMNRQKDLFLIDQILHSYYLGAAHGSSYRNTVYIDRRKAVVYTLDDLFKKDSDVYAYLSEAVSAQMVETMEEVGYWEDHVTVTPDTGFVIAEEGLILYFGEYEIASYAAGLPEFLIPYTDLMGYINTEGDFWRSFN